MRLTWTKLREGFSHLELIRRKIRFSNRFHFQFSLIEKVKILNRFYSLIACFYRSNNQRHLIYWRKQIQLSRRFVKLSICSFDSTNLLIIIDCHCSLWINLSNLPRKSNRSSLGFWIITRFLSTDFKISRQRWPLVENSVWHFSKNVRGGNTYVVTGCAKIVVLLTLRCCNVLVMLRARSMLWKPITAQWETYVYMRADAVYYKFFTFKLKNPVHTKGENTYAV